MKVFVHLNIRRTRRLLGVLDDADGSISFQFDPDFARMGPEVSPFAVPLGTAPWRNTSGLFNGGIGGLHPLTMSLHRTVLAENT